MAAQLNLENGMEANVQASGVHGQHLLASVSGGQDVGAQETMKGMLWPHKCAQTWCTGTAHRDDDVSTLGVRAGKWHVDRVCFVRGPLLHLSIGTAT